MPADRSRIDRLYRQGLHTEALDSLEQLDPCAWRDTTRLRCLRAMNDKATAIKLAIQQYKLIKSDSLPYPANVSERNHQLRYIALVFANGGKAKQACSIMRRLCEQSPDVAALHREYAFALNNDNRQDQAEAEYLTALKIEPTHANTHAQLARLYCHTGRVNTGYNSYSKAASLKPDDPNYIQRLIYWSNYSEQTTQQSNYQLTRLWARRAHPYNQAGTNTWRHPKADRPLKIGFVSSDFCVHPKSYFLIPLLEGLNRTQFQVTAFSDTREHDQTGKSIKELCDVWHETAGLSDKAMSKVILSEQIDILIDLKGHSTGNRLGVFAKHVAPLQISWLGYPATTGLRSIHYRITDRVADPIGINDQFYSEQLIRLGNGLLCYKPLHDTPKIAPDESEDTIRLGSFNNLAKVSSLTLDSWAAAKRAVPNATLYVKNEQLRSKRSRTQLIRELVERGVAQDRLILSAAKYEVDKHLHEYNQIDIALDTTPFNGSTTAIEALSMGVPVVSLMGQTHASRITASILERLNLSGLAVENIATFAQRVKELSELGGTSKEQRLRLRNQLQQSSLMNAHSFGQEFGAALRQKWQEWCTEQAQLKTEKSPKAGAAGGQQ